MLPKPIKIKTAVQLELILKALIIQQQKLHHSPYPICYAISNSCTYTTQAGKVLPDPHKVEHGQLLYNNIQSRLAPYHTLDSWYLAQCQPMFITGKDITKLRIQWLINSIKHATTQIHDEFQQLPTAIEILTTLNIKSLSDLYS